MEKPSDRADGIARGRQAFDRHHWADAYAELSAVETALEPEDLERLALAAHLVGRDAESEECWTRAHAAFLIRGSVEGAARCAYWVGFLLLARGRRLLDDGKLDCVEQGYFLVPVGLQLMGAGDPTGASATFEQVISLGERFGDPDLVATGRLGRGQALIHSGETARGLTLLDEVMVAATGGELSPLCVGIIYCAVIEICQQIFDLQRAHEWTAALSRWCESQPGLIPYRGPCLVHRAEIMQLQGAWPAALAEAQQACERFSQTAGRTWLGAAYYQQGELYRLRGDFPQAEAAYRESNRWGKMPEPGLALLHLAQGHPETAVAAIDRAVAEVREPAPRANLLPAQVEIRLATGDVPGARAAADELSAIAATLGASLLDAWSAQTTGAVLLAEGDAPGALRALRAAWTAWYALEAPYHAARARVLIALACRSLGDADSAEAELDAARQIFQQLGARPDLRRLAVRFTPRTALDMLTLREVEVLRLVAAGKSNQEIATDLVLSGHTVRRHLQNIFAKLAVSSRTAAAAFAYEHGLV
jgi:DNA-binding NarL/FixJ family response regulator